ncbi:GPO family capsid scaffolding protein [Aeromonas molluscorum]|uniref:GPO family capsid scaffolding protein n=1 Tax=Aeromonas molluscorum TaxID=271417 RepID=UPI003F19B2C5
MNESTLRTGFVCIATEGKAVDGRDITRDWLVDMAETYDPSYYTAVIWPEHDRWSSYGTVQALKTEEVDGKLKLFAVLCPNRDLVYWNQSGQYQFCSIEPFEQFADLGRTYLIGLGVTDQPASTGTTTSSSATATRARPSAPASRWISPCSHCPSTKRPMASWPNFSTLWPAMVNLRSPNLPPATPRMRK